MEHTKSQTVCGCMTCDEKRRDTLAEQGDWLGAIGRPFIVCPDCGNKRCPKATYHDNDCSGSNASGQEGSVYVNAPTVLSFAKSAAEPLERDEHDRCAGCLYSAGHALDCPACPQSNPD